MTYFKPGQDIPLFGNLDKPVVPKLSIIDLPAMNIQAHCHEGSNEGMRSSTHFKEYGKKEHIPILNSYEFAMGDLYAEKLGINTIKK